MNINETPAAWNRARQYYEEIKANDGNCDPRLYDELDSFAHAGMEWPRLLFAALCLNPSMVDDFNPRKARRLIHSLIQDGHLDSVCALAEYLVIHEGDNPIAEEVGMEALRAAADAGHTGSQHLLALFLFDGVGTEKDPEEALRLLTRAADADDSEAQLALAYRYLYAEDVPRNRALAIRYARRARELGNEESFWILWEEEPDE